MLREDLITLVELLEQYEHEYVKPYKKPYTNCQTKEEYAVSNMACGHSKAINEIIENIYFDM